MATIRTLRANLEASGASEFRKEMKKSAEAAHTLQKAVESSIDANDSFGESMESASEIGSGFALVMAQRVARGAAAATGSLVGLVEIGIGQAAAGIENLGQQIQNRSEDMKRFGSVANATGLVLEGLGDTVNKVAEGLTALRLTLAAVIGTTLAGSVKTANTFEESFNRIETVVPMAAGELEDLRSELSALSAETGISAATVNETFFKAITRMPRLAEDSEKALGLVRTALEAQATGFTTATQAVETYEAVLQGFQLRAEDAESISSKLFRTQQLAGVTFDRIAKSIGDVASITDALGGSFEELLAVYATLVPTGQSVSEVTTQLRSVISGIIDPIDRASPKARKLGIDMSAAAVRSEGLLGVIGEIIRRTEGDPEILSRLFGRREAVAFLATIANRMGTVNERQRQIIASTDDHQQTLETINESISRQKSLIAQEWVDSLRSLGFTLKDLLDEPFLGFLKGIRLTSQAITGLVDGILGAVNVLNDFGEALLSVATGQMDKARQNIGEIADALEWTHIPQAIRETSDGLMSVLRMLDDVPDRAGRAQESMQEMAETVRVSFRPEGEVPDPLQFRLPPRPGEPISRPAIPLRPMAEMVQKMERLSQQAQVFGENFDLAGESAKVIRQTITDFLDLGLTPSSRIIQQLSDMLLIINERAEQLQNTLRGLFLGGLPGLPTRRRDVAGLFGLPRPEQLSQLLRQQVQERFGVARSQMAFGRLQRMAGERIDIQNIADARSELGKGTSDFEKLGSVFGESVLPAIAAVTGAADNMARSLLQGAGSILQGLARFGVLAGPFGAAGSVLGAFAGFFQHGGHIGRGQFGVVGERGPEFVQGPATVSPGGLTISVDASSLPAPRTPFEQARDQMWQELLDESARVNKQSGGELG